MAGVMLMVMGLTGLGTAVKYIPRPVVIGFTNGIAVLIASTQIKDFFGMHIDKVPGDFIGRVAALIRGFPTLSTPATVAGVAGIALIVVLIKVSRRIPCSIVALVIGTIIIWKYHLPVETLQTRFGGISRWAPALGYPSLPAGFDSGLARSRIHG